MALFKRLDGEPMQFYLAELSEETFKKYKNLIEVYVYLRYIYTQKIPKNTFLRIYLFTFIKGM